MARRKTKRTCPISATVRPELRAYLDERVEKEERSLSVIVDEMLEAQRIFLQADLHQSVKNTKEQKAA